MLLASNCFNLLSREECMFYLGFCDDKPVATIATMKYGEDASIEFVSVAKEYRRRGFGKAMCRRALNDLKHGGSSLVTLRSSEMAVGLYEELGFRKFFTVVGMNL